MEGFRVLYPKDRVSFEEDLEHPKGPIALAIRRMGKRRNGGRDGENP